MKKWLLTLALAASGSIAMAQVQSSCTPPPQLVNQYELDVRNLALRRMFALHSPDTIQVTIPGAWKDTIMQGLAAIYNSGLAESDTIFNKYCVHDLFPYPRAANRYIAIIDTNVAWTQAWRQLNSVTGNTFVDQFSVTHGITILEYQQWFTMNAIIFSTADHLHPMALADSLMMAPGIYSVEEDGMVGQAGSMFYTVNGTDRYYGFQFEFNDCFDGCDNLRRWNFKVTSDCQVEYLGYIDWGYFSIEPLPPALNCNMNVGIEPELPEDNWTVYPNPAGEWLHIQTPDAAEQITLTDLSGRTLISEQNTQSVNVSHLSNGIYIVTVHTGQHELKRQVIVQH